MSRSEQLAFLANDVAILETLFANRDGNRLVIPGQYMPDGKKFEIDVTGVERMTGELRLQCVNLVRSQYDARDNSQANQEQREGGNSERSSGGGQRSGQSGADSQRTTSPVQDKQETMEAYVESQVTLWRTRVERAESDAKMAQLALDRARQELKKAEALAECILELQNESLST